MAKSKAKLYAPDLSDPDVVLPRVKGSVARRVMRNAIKRLGGTEWLCDSIAEGMRYKDLCSHINDAIRKSDEPDEILITVGRLTRYLYKLRETDPRIAEAYRASGEGHLEQAMDKVENDGEPPRDSAEASAQNNRARVRLWTAERRDRKNLGAEKAGPLVNIQLDAGSAMLEAFRALAAEPIAAKALPSAETVIEPVVEE